MLLIGSRATKFLFSDARKPNDWDFIATSKEVDDFLSNYEYINTSKHSKKRQAKVNINGELINFEFDLVEAYESNKLLYDLNYVNHFDSYLNIDYKIASPDVLFLLKRSHVVFNIHWNKNIYDYLFLKRKVNLLSYELDNILKIRFEETKNKLNFKEFNFDVDNSEFFNKSEKFVNRVFEHDSIHYATCFGEKPIFLSAKKDITQAALDEELINDFSHELKIKMIQEEIIALALERYIIPSLIQKLPYDSSKAYQTIACKMVYNYLPLFLRHFAADNFIEISNAPFDYVEKFCKNHNEFQKY